MSINASVTLPSQPATGSTVIRPLGGDGYTSPQSYYLAEITTASDASGGTITLNIVTDPQFQSVISIVNLALLGASADVLASIGMFTQESDVVFQTIGNMLFDADAGQHMLYSPPPLFPCRRIRTVIDNVDAQTFEFAILVYNFKRDAFQKVPLNILLDALPRGFSI